MNLIRTGMFSISLLAALILMTAGTTQAQGVQLKTHIPFGFHVGAHYLPAGDYLVRPISNSVTNLMNTKTKDLAMIPVFRVNSTDGPRPARLVFEQYGQDTFLTQLWDGSDVGLTPVPSKRERELAKLHTPVRTSAIARR